MLFQRCRSKFQARMCDVMQMTAVRTTAHDCDGKTMPAALVLVLALAGVAVVPLSGAWLVFDGIAELVVDEVAG